MEISPKLSRPVFEYYNPMCNVVASDRPVKSQAFYYNHSDSNYMADLKQHKLKCNSFYN